MTAVATSREQSLRAALLWAGDASAAAGRPAATIYRLEGVSAARPEHERSSRPTVGAGTTTRPTTSAIARSGASPGRLGSRLVFATWEKVTHHPTRFIDELKTAMATPWSGWDTHRT
jgi:hypothetical protein